MLLPFLLLFTCIYVLIPSNQTADIIAKKSQQIPTFTKNEAEKEEVRSHFKNLASTRIANNLKCDESAKIKSIMSNRIESVRFPTGVKLPEDFAEFLQISSQVAAVVLVEQNWLKCSEVMEFTFFVFDPNFLRLTGFQSFPQV